MKLLKFTHYLPCFRTGSDDEYEPSMKAVKRVSEELSARLSLRTAFLTLLLVIVVPFLNYSVTDFSPKAWVTNYKMIAKNETVNSYDIANIARKTDNFYRYKDSKAYLVQISSPYIEDSPFIAHYQSSNNIRLSNLIYYKSDYRVLGKSYGVKLTIDNTIPNQMDAMYNILLIILVIIVLFVFSASFSQAVKDLVVKPLEKMMKALRNSALLMIKSLEELSATKDATDGVDATEKEKDIKKVYF